MILALLISLILLWPAAQENYFSQGFAKNQFSSTLVIQSDASVMPGPDRASEMADQVGHDGEFDMDEYLYGHVVDAYDWHITTVNGKHISIPLLIIARSKTTGWHVFSSGKLAHGHEYEGFYLWHDQESHRDRLMEHTPSGDVRPLDISITKNVAGLLFNSLVLVLLVLFGVKWYRRHDAREEAPGGFSGLLEMLVMMVEDDIIKPCIGPDYKRYSPYLLTAFFFIFVNNLLGIVPFFPGGANITGNIAVTFMMAVFTFLAVNLFGNKHYYKDIFWPEVPLFLKAFPLMPYPGRAHDDSGRGVGGLPYGLAGPGHERRPQRHRGPFRRVHGCVGTPGGLPPGLYIYHAFQCVYRPEPAAPGRRKSRRITTLKTIEL